MRRAFICDRFTSFTARRVEQTDGRVLTPARGFVFVLDDEGTVWMVVRGTHT